MTVVISAAPRSQTGSQDVRHGAGDAPRKLCYRILARLLSGAPSAATLQAVASLKPGDAGDRSDRVPWRRLIETAARADPVDLDNEYHDLFIGVGRGELLPFGSWYTTGMLMDRPLAELRQDLARFGIECQSHVKEPEDHIAALCDAMAIIIGATAEIPVSAQQAFFRTHLEPWAARFFDNLGAAQTARFYRMVGLFGSRFMSFESRYFNLFVSP